MKYWPTYEHASERRTGTFSRMKRARDALAGEKVGTISHIYRRAPAAVTSGGGVTPPAAEPVTPTQAEAIEVKSGFLGLGRHLYVPIGAVQEVLNNCVFLSKPKEVFDELG